MLAPTPAQLLAGSTSTTSPKDSSKRSLAGIDLDELSEADQVRVVRRRSSNRFYFDRRQELDVVDETRPPVPRAGGGADLARARARDPVDGRKRRRRPHLHGKTARRRRPWFEVLRARSLALAAAGGARTFALGQREASGLHGRWPRPLPRGLSILLFNHIHTSSPSLKPGGTGMDRRPQVGTSAAACYSWRSASRGWGIARRERRGRPRAQRGVRALQARARARNSRRWVLSLVGMARLLGGDLEEQRLDLDQFAELWPGRGLGLPERPRCAWAWLAMALGT